jgi:CheY-like chemotaxis protein
VTIAANGREALEQFEKESFDLVFMDIQMLEMDGFEATAAIRERDRRTARHVPIIAMTPRHVRRSRSLSGGRDGQLRIQADQAPGSNQCNRKLLVPERDGQRGGLRGFRQGERDDGNEGQLDHG